MIEQLVTSSTLILILLVLSVLLEKKINPCLKYALWLLAVIKLLVPLPQFPSHISIINVVQNITLPSSLFSDIENFSNVDAIANNASSRNTIHTYNEAAQSNNSASDGDDSFNKNQNKNASFINDEATDFTVANHRQLYNTLFCLCSTIWFVGAIICIVVFVWANLRFAYFLKNNRTFDGYIKTSLPSGKLPIYKSTEIISPCLFGIFHPAIYIPENIPFTRTQKADILAHEYTHFRHGDTFWALIRCLCTALYWYNPLIWLGARTCIRDSELACDYGTLKFIGNENRIRYGQTLISTANAVTTTEKLSKLSSANIWNCSTQATSGKQEMKKRIQMIVKPPVSKKYHIFILLFLCVNIVGCTFGSTATQKTKNTTLTENDAENRIENQSKQNDIQTESFTDTDTSQKDIAWNATQTEEGMIYNNIPLYYTRKENQVCIEVQPSVIRAYISYYYIPTGKVQQRLTELVRDLDLEAKPFNYRWQGMKESGWKLCYQDLKLTAFDGGYLYCCWEDSKTNSSMEYLIQDTILYNEIQNILKDTLDYQQFNAADIKDIVSAKLELQNRFTDYELRSQTITDQETLQILEELFSNAAYIYGGAECGNQSACLELTLADGQTVKLSIAIDSCTNCSINGVYYDYRPLENRKKGGWYSTDFFQYFDQIQPLLPL